MPSAINLVVVLAEPKPDRPHWLPGLTHARRSMTKGGFLEAAEWPKKD